MTVAGDLTFNGTGRTTGGEIDVSGNVTCTSGSASSTVISKLVGGSPTLTGGATCYLGAVNVDVSGTLTLSGTVQVASDWTWTTGALTATGSTLSIDNTSTVTPGTVSYNNFTLASTGITSMTGIMTVTGNLLFNGTGRSTGGEIDVAGNVTCTSGSASSTVLTAIVGATPTLTGSSSCYLGAVNVDVSDTLTLSGTVQVASNWTWTDGALAAGSSTLSINNTSTVTPGTVTYNNFTLASAQTTTMSGTMTIGGNLVLNGTGKTINGEIDVTGNVTCTTGSVNSTTLMQMVGASPTLSGTASCYLGAAQINVSGTLTMSGTVQLANNWTWTAGALTATGSTLSVKNTSTIIPGTVSYDNFILGSGQTTTFSGTMTVLGDLTWNGNGKTTGGEIDVSGNVNCTAASSKTSTVLVKVLGAAPTITGGATCYMGSVTVNTSGTVTLSGPVQVAVNLTWTAGTLSAGTSSLTFVGTGTFTPGTGSYYDLAFSAAGGTVTLPSMATATATDSLTVTNTKINTGTINVAGAYTIGATSVGANGTSVVNLNGSSDQSITSTGGAMRNPITVTKTSGKATVDSNMTFNGSVTVTQGELRMGAFTNTYNSTVSVGGSGIWSNYSASASTVLLASTVSSSGNISFHSGNSTCGSAKTITLSSTQAAHQRAWSGTGFNSIQDAIVQDQGGTASITCYNCTNVSGNAATWTFSGCVTGVELESFTATDVTDGVDLAWHTGYETSLLGFNVYRSDGVMRQLNSDLIPSSMLSQSETPYGYHFHDAAAAATTVYWLELLELAGSGHWYGPVSPMPLAVPESPQDAETPEPTDAGMNSGTIPAESNQRTSASVTSGGCSFDPASSSDGVASGMLLLLYWIVRRLGQRRVRPSYFASRHKMSHSSLNSV